MPLYQTDLEVKVGFEPTILRICNPLPWATRPLHRIVWLRSLESNQASWINSPPPTPCLLDRNCLVEMTGLEPATYWLQTSRSTR
jgi:hypothetical protein